MTLKTLRAALLLSAALTWPEATALASSDEVTIEGVTYSSYGMAEVEDCPASGTTKVVIKDKVTINEVECTVQNARVMLYRCTGITEVWVPAGLRSFPSIDVDRDATKPKLCVVGAEEPSWVYDDLLDDVSSVELYASYEATTGTPVVLTFTEGDVNYRLLSATTAKANGCSAPTEGKVKIHSQVTHDGVEYPISSISGTYTKATTVWLDGEIIYSSASFPDATALYVVGSTAPSWIGSLPAAANPMLVANFDATNGTPLTFAQGGITYNISSTTTDADGH